MGSALTNNFERRSLARSNATISVVGNKSYVFGGERADGELASNDVHAITLEASGKAEPEYHLLPPVTDPEGGDVPAARTKHSACAFNVCVAVYGGCDAKGDLVDKESIIWLYNTGKSAWESMKSADPKAPAPGSRSQCSLFNFKNNILLYGGKNDQESVKDLWYFDYAGKTWTQLPSAPVSVTNAALADGSLYLISGQDSMSSQVHSLDIGKALEEARNPVAQEPQKPSSDVEDEEEPSPSIKWTTTTFPTNPLTPGPRPRFGGGLLPISTGYGRNYLLYFFGSRQSPLNNNLDPSTHDDPTQWSDIWTYQVESATPQAKATTSFTDMVKPAAIKDAIRSKLGYDSGQHSWAEVEVQAPGDITDVGEGKLHPGPRGFFGADVMEDGRTVVIWGGINARGEREGDGWMIRLQ